MYPLCDLMIKLDMPPKSQDPGSEGLLEIEVSAQTFRLSRRIAVLRFIALTCSFHLIDILVSK